MWWPIAAALATTLAFFHRALLSTDIFIARDNLRVSYPARSYWAERVLGLGFPEWFPFDGLGESFVANTITGALHPSNFLLLLLPLDSAYKLITVACFPIALLGTYLLARLWDAPRGGAFLAGITYAFSGYLVCITNNQPYLLAAASVPLGVWGAVRFLRKPLPGRLLSAGALLASILFAGDPQGFAVTVAIALVVAATDGKLAWRSRLGRAAVLLLVTVLLASPQLLPSVLVLGEARPGAGSLQQAQQFSVDPLRLLEPLLGPYFVPPDVETFVPPLLVTNLLATGGFSTLWVDSLFIGVPALILAMTALIARWRSRVLWLWTALWSGLIALSLGPVLPVYALVYQAFPPWRVFRYPEKLLPFVVLGIAVACAFGWKWLSESGRSRTAIRVAAVLGASCAVLLVAELTLGVWSRGLLLKRWPEIPAKGLEGLASAFVHACVLSLGIASACAVLLSRGRSHPAVPWVLCVIQFATAFHFNQPLYQLASSDLVTTTPPFAEVIWERHGSGNAEPIRIVAAARSFKLPPAREGDTYFERYGISVVRALSPNVASLWGIENAEGYLPGVSRRVSLLKRDYVRWHKSLWPKLGIRWAVFNQRGWDALDRPGTLASTDPQLNLVLVESEAPVRRIFLAHPRCVTSPEEAYAFLVQAPAGAEAAVECGDVDLEGGSAGRTPDGALHVTRYDPELIEVEMDVKEPGVLVINDAFASGWSATIDGAPAPILPANAAVRAVPVSPGARHLVLRYQAPGLRLGAAIAVLVALALLAASIGSRIHGRRQPASDSPVLAR